MATFQELAETANRRAKILAEHDYRTEWGNEQDAVLEALIERVRTCEKCEHLQKCSFEATFLSILERAVKDMLIVQFNGHNGVWWLHRYEDATKIQDGWGFFTLAKCIKHNESESQV